MLTFFVDSIVSAFSIGIFHFPSNTFTTFGSLNVFIVVIARVFNLILYQYVFLKIKKKQFHHDLKNKYLVILICNFIIIIPIIIGFYVVQNLSARLSWISILSGILMISEIVFCLMISWESNSDMQKAENAIAQVKMMKMQMEYSESITEMSQEMRKLRHDFNNHLSTIIHLIEHSQIKEAVSYIKQLNCVVDTAMDVCTIDNTILRAVITDKKRKARRKNILCDTLITVSQFPLDEIELNSLLSNILDNAIEANEKVDQEEKRKIHMEITRDQENIFIECTNSLAKQPDLKKGRMITSKGNKSAHGMGMKIIETIVKKYEGDLNTFYNHEIFRISILLPCGEVK